MPLLPMFLNGLSVISARVTMPGTGVWIADLEVDLGLTGIMPVGKAVFSVGTSLLVGTIDARASGKFGPTGHAQLVGGGGGWDTTVPALHLHNDAGVISTAVYSVTAASVGEVVVDTLPARLGTDYVRTAGPASRVLKDVDWYVSIAGVTVVGPRAPIPFNPLDVEILSWDPDSRCATLASGEIVLPGTVLIDLRFGTATIRDVEQTFDADGARVLAWCATSDIPAVPGLPATEVAGSRLARALGALAREAAGVSYLRRYRYRVVVQGADKRVTLQAVSLLSPAPAILQQVDIWSGVPGITARVTPGTEVSVVFNDGDPAQPIVVGFAASSPPPLEIDLLAIRFAVGLGTSPAALATPLLAWCLQVEAALSALAHPVATTAALSGITSTKLFTE